MKLDLRKVKKLRVEGERLSQNSDSTSSGIFKNGTILPLLNQPRRAHTPAI